MVRELEIDELGIQNPAGIAFSQQANVFHVMESNRPSYPPFGYSDIVMITAVEDRIGSARLAATIADPKNTAFDDKFNRLLIFQTNAKKLISVDATPDGGLDASSLKRLAARDFNLQDPQGMAVDPASGQVFILDRAVPQIVQIQPAKDGSFEGAAISQVALPMDSSPDLKGLAFEPTSGHFHVLNPTDQVLYEITTAGQLTSVRDISSLDLGDPQSMVFAPSGDPTDDPAILSLYVIDTISKVTTIDPSSNLYNSKNELQVQAAGQPMGQIVELSLIPIPQSAAAVPTDSVTLVKTTDTSEYSPPSPDPSGLAYLSDSNKLIISDGEVNEIEDPNPAAYTGVNLFITTLVGSLDSTLTTDNPTADPPITFSDEPTGVAYIPANSNNNNKNLLYFSDDTPPMKGVYELDPGADGIFNTADDTVESFNTGAINGNDPEGIAFDNSRGKGHLLVVDGVGKEVFDIDLGSNGTLDPTDSVTHFDIGPQSTINLEDPEGIEFNPDNNHLYILDSSSQKRIAETTIDGTLIRYLDISATNPDSPAGLTYAPASDGSGGSNLYIVDRGEDNGSNPMENDGKMYEVSFPLQSNAPPTVDAGPDQTISFGESAILDGTVDDDGNPDPPATVTTLWSQVSVPQTGVVVIFADPNAVDTTASNFTVPGEYILRLTADDSEQTYYDEVTITVSSGSNQPPSVDAGSNQTITFPASAVLDGTVTDDGLPIPPGEVTTSWNKISGPSDVDFDDASAVNTTANFSVEGVYILRLTADDDQFSKSDDVTITVNPEINLPPTVDAGTNQTITLPEVAVLDATVTDDGLPIPPGKVTTSWNKMSGPGEVTFTDASEVDTTARFSTDGDYVLRLTAVDGDESAYDEVTITVITAPVENIWLPFVITTTANR